MLDRLEMQRNPPKFLEDDEFEEGHDEVERILREAGEADYRDDARLQRLQDKAESAYRACDHEFEGLDPNDYADEFLFELPKNSSVDDMELGPVIMEDFLLPKPGEVPQNFIDALEGTGGGAGEVPAA